MTIDEHENFYKENVNINIDVRPPGSGKTTEMVNRFMTDSVGYLITHSYEHIDKTLKPLMEKNIQSFTLYNEKYRNRKVEYKFIKSMDHSCSTIKKFESKKRRKEMFWTEEQEYLLENRHYLSTAFKNRELHDKFCNDPDCPYRIQEKLKPTDTHIICTIDMFLSLIKNPKNLRNNIYVDEDDGLFFKERIGTIEFDSRLTIENDVRLGEDYYRIDKREVNNKKVLNELKKTIKDKVKNHEKIDRNIINMIRIIEDGWFIKKKEKIKNVEKEIIYRLPKIFFIFKVISEMRMMSNRVNVYFNGFNFSKETFRNEVELYRGYFSLPEIEYNFKFTTKPKEVYLINNDLTVTINGFVRQIPEADYLKNVKISRLYEMEKNGELKGDETFYIRSKIRRELINLIKPNIKQNRDYKVAVITFREVEDFVKDEIEKAWLKKNVLVLHFGNEMKGRTLDDKVDALYVYGDFTDKAISERYKQYIIAGRFGFDVKPEVDAELRDKILYEKLIENVQAMNRIRGDKPVYWITKLNPKYEPILLEKFNIKLVRINVKNTNN